MTPQTNQEPPVADPVVTIGGRALTVVYNLRAQFKLSEWGIDPRQFSCLLGATEDPRRVFYAFQCFAASVAGNFVNGPAPTAEEWAARIGNDLDQLGLIFNAIGVALGKHIRATAKRLSPSVMAPTPEASTNAVN